MEDEYEQQTYFIGPCICDHEEEEHSWGACDTELPDGSDCPCEAGWEE
jgi:hypothetical protein